MNTNRTLPSYNGGPTFQAGDVVKILTRYAGGQHEAFPVERVAGPYTVVVDGRTRGVGDLEHAEVAGREPAACAECGHAHYYVIHGRAHYGPCPIDGCDCRGQAVAS